MRAYLEHVALKVADIDWHIRFFADVLGMPVREEMQAGDGLPRQVWTLGGLQLIAAPDFGGPEGRLAHLGIFVEDQEAALTAAARWRVTVLPRGRNWLRLPDGLEVEILQEERPGAVAAALAVIPRA